MLLELYQRKYAGARFDSSVAFAAFGDTSGVVTCDGMLNRTQESARVQTSYHAAAAVMTDSHGGLAVSAADARKPAATHVL